MDQLIESGLYGTGLVPINTPTLVKRYNACLKDMDINPTELSEFHIDAMGWSPEIAEEHDNLSYLSHGEANPLAIVITPTQALSPVCVPFHSFDRVLMQMIFATVRRQISDLTHQTGIWFDIDQEVTKYLRPTDLLMVESVTICPRTVGRIITAAREQRMLVNEFNSRDDAWFDPELRAQLIASAQTHGDLRRRKVDIPDLPFTGVHTFFTRAFGGMFILRDLKEREYMIIMEDSDIKMRHEARTQGVFTTDSRNLFEDLFKEGLIEVPIDWYQDNPYAVSERQESLFAEAFFQKHGNDVDFLELTTAQRKKHIVDLEGKIPSEYFELERLHKQLQTDAHIERSDLSKELQRLLIRPHRELTLEVQDVIWLLIVKMGIPHILRLYKSDKWTFYSEYRTWPAAKQRWAISIVSEFKRKESQGENV